MEAVAGGPRRRDVVLEAAVTVIADEGMRGLTHRAVDRTAGIPTGSTSYYFRTRRALLVAVVEHLLESHRADTADGALTPPADPADLDALADLATRLLVRLLTTRRRHALARYACLLEAARDPALAPLLAIGQPFRAWGAELARNCGADAPERRGRDLIACLDGLLFDRLAGPGSVTAPPADTTQGHDEIHDTVRDLLRTATGR